MEKGNSHVILSGFDLELVSAADPGPNDLLEFKVEITHQEGDAPAEVNNFRLLLVDDANVTKASRKLLSLILCSSGYNSVRKLCTAIVNHGGVNLNAEIRGDEIAILPSIADGHKEFVFKKDSGLIYNPAYGEDE